MELATGIFSSAANSDCSLKGGVFVGETEEERAISEEGNGSRRLEEDKVGNSALLDLYSKGLTSLSERLSISTGKFGGTLSSYQPPTSPPSLLHPSTDSDLALSTRQDVKRIHCRRKIDPEDRLWRILGAGKGAARWRTSAVQMVVALGTSRHQSSQRQIVYSPNLQSHDAVRTQLPSLLA